MFLSIVSMGRVVPVEFEVHYTVLNLPPESQYQ